MPPLPVDLGVLASGALAGAIVQFLNMLGSWKKGRRDDTTLILQSWRDLAASLQAQIANLRSEVAAMRVAQELAASHEADCQRKLDELLARPAGPAVVQHITNTTPPSSQ